MYVDEFLYIEGHKYFKEIYKEYPDSYYILQTRNLDDWINSRLAHFNGIHTLLERTQKTLNFTTVDQTVEFWKEDRDLHEKSVTDFFKHKGTFLKFNIDIDNIEKIVHFLRKDFSLDYSKWKKHNITRNKV